MDIAWTPPGPGPVNSIGSTLAAALALLRTNPRNETPVFGLQAAQVSTLTRKALGALAESGRPLASDEAAAVSEIDDMLHACYARVGHAMLADRETLARLPDTFMQASADLFHDLASLHASRQFEARPNGAAEISLAWSMGRALWCLGTYAKWTYIMHRASDGELWRELHGLYLRVESPGIANEAVRLYKYPDPLSLSGADLYVQSLLLGMLNAGNLTPAQVELAHRWVTAFVRGIRVDTNNDSTEHAFRVRLDSDHGAELSANANDGAGTLRFVDIEPVCAKLIESRENLRHGRIDLGEMEAEAVVLDYGAFLDLAERFWSPDLQRVHDRAPRVTTKEELFETITGFDGVIAVCAGTGRPDGEKIAMLRPALPGAAGGTAQWALRDRSESGIGMLIPANAADVPAVGALVAFRPLRSRQWEIGTMKRRLSNADGGRTLIGVKLIADHPVLVTLRSWRSAGQAPAQCSRAIFAPSGCGTNRVDSLVVDVATYAGGGDLLLPAGDVGYHIRFNRVLDRGDGWVRAGFGVLARRALQEEVKSSAV